MLKKFLSSFIILLGTCFAQNSFFSDRAVALNPMTNGLVPIPYGQVRVCTNATSVTPCPNLATVFDAVTGAQLTVSPSNFGQLTTDFLGRFSFQALAGNYYLQVAGAASNTPQISYTVSLPITSASGAQIVGANNIFTGSNIFSGPFIASGGTPYIDITGTPYNAKCDSTTDDTAAINSAIAAANAARLAVFVPPTTTGCLASGALNLTNLTRGFKFFGQTTIARGQKQGSVIIANNTSGSKVQMDLTGSFDLEISDLSLVPPSSGGAAIGILCARNAGNTGVQHLSLNHVSVDLNTTGLAGTPSIGFYNAGCELNTYSDIYLESDLPLYGTAANPPSATFPVTSPFLTTTGGTSTSENTCLRCTLVSDSSLQPPLVLENIYDWDFSTLYITCKGAGASTQYAMSASQTQNLRILGRQENCGLAAHILGSMNNSSIRFTNAVGSATANNYVVVDGTVSATAYPFNGNDFSFYDNSVKTAFTSYRWNTQSSEIMDNTFDVRSAGCDGNVSMLSSGNVGGQIVKGSSHCADPTVTSTGGFNSYILLLPDQILLNGHIRFGALSVAPAVVGTLGLGTTALPFTNMYLGAAATNNFFFNPVVTAAPRTVSLPDPGNNVKLGFNLNGTTGVYQSLKGITGCTTGAAAGNACGPDITVTWGTTFADANYSVTCTGNAPTNAPSAPFITSGTKLAGSVHINYFAITAAAASYASIDCLATHD